MPYRHESTYPVTLDELLGLLENLIETIANPRTSRRGIQFEPVEVPNFKEYFVSLENLIGKYEDLIVNKIHDAGSGLFSAIVSDLDPIDKIRTFFAILFLAKDEKVELEQTEDDIIITLVK
jgi:segregation and condensation protein A